MGRSVAGKGRFDGRREGGGEKEPGIQEEEKLSRGDIDEEGEYGGRVFEGRKSQKGKDGG